MFSILNKPNLGTPLTETFNLITENSIVKADTIQLDTVTVNKTASNKITYEKYEEHNINTHETNVIMGETLEKVNATHILSSNTNQDKIRFSENAPVIFLHDLKVANYHLYYFKGQSLVNIQRNVEAAYQNAGEKSSNVTSSNKMYYLHNAINDLMLNFKKQKFQNCLTLIETIKKYNADDVNCLFYESMCYYQLKNYKKAMEQFNSVRTHNVNIFKEEADYYYALCCIKTNTINEAKEILNEIVMNEGFYAPRAKEQLLVLK
jgi:tetratricopeptide (TPR) repeat protein